MFTGLPLTISVALLNTNLLCLAALGDHSLYLVVAILGQALELGGLSGSEGGVAEREGGADGDNQEGAAEDG